MKSPYSVKQRAFLFSNVFWIFLLCIPFSQAQNYEYLIPSIPQPLTIKDNNLVELKDDTTIIMDQIRYAKSLTNKWYWLNLDTVSYLFHQIIPKCKEKKFDLGLMYCYRNLGWSFLLKDFGDSAIYYFTLANTLNDIVCDNQITYFNYMDLGRAFSRDSKYDSAVIMFQTAKDFTTRLQDTSGMRSAISYLSKTYLVANEMIMVTKYSFELMDLAEIRQDTFELLLAYESLITVYSSMRMTEELIKNRNTILQIGNHTKKIWIKYQAYLMASRSYYSAAQYDSTIYYAKLVKSLGDTTIQGLTIHWNIAGAYLILNEVDSARHYYKTWYDKALPTGKHIPAEVTLGLGECEFRKGNYPKALEYFLLAEIGEDQESLVWKKQIAQQLSEYYEATEQPIKAFHYYRKSKILEDSLENQKDEFGIGKAFMEKDAEKDRKLIELLSKEKELQSDMALQQKNQKYMVFAGSALFLLAGGFGFIRYRKLKDLKNKQSLLNERLRISRDLHDEVGATLGGIAMYSHLAKSQLGNSPPSSLTKSLDTIQQSSAEMVAKLSDIVWLLNPAHDTLLQLMDKLEDYAKQMASVKHVQVTFTLPEDLAHISLPVESRRNIYLIFKEAIHNSLKYSFAREMHMGVQSNHQSVRIHWRDNGSGFDMMNDYPGNGLKNMQRRAEEIHGKLQIESNIQGGTNIEIQINI